MRRFNVALLFSVLAAGITMFSVLGSTATGASKKPLVIGVPTSVSSPGQASSFLGVKRLIAVWQKQVNAEGGINGYPVKTIVTDSAANPAKALANVKQLVEKNKVQALAGQFDNQDVAWQKYVEDNKIPVLGGQPTDPPSWTSPMFFPTGGSLIANFYGTALQAKKFGKNKFTVAYCAEAPVCGIIPKGFDGILKNVVKSGSVVHSASIAATAANYTAPCLAGRSAGADAMFVANAEAIVNRYVDDCAKQGYKPKQYQVAGDVGPIYAKNPNGAGTLITLNAKPLAANSTPGEKRLHRAIKKYDPSLNNKSAAWNETLASVWAGLELYRKIGTKEKLTPTSKPANVLAGVYKLKNETLNGLTVPLNYKKGKPTLNNCVYPVRISKGILAPDGKPICIPANLVALTYKQFS